MNSLKSKTTEKFRKAYRELPTEIQRLARESYRLWQSNPSHPNLHFKKSPRYEADLFTDVTR
ncbi:MAG: hypothetical protein M3X11_23690 [Acidobacteriota bacterium]|nr:hypothetical protein [Acidobacteriota bacterium]